MIEIKELYRQKRYDILLLMLAAGFPIYKYSISSIILIAFSLTSIFLYFHNTNVVFERTFFLKKLRYFLITTGFFLVMICSLLYTTNIKSGLRDLQFEIYILVYPLIIILFVGDISKKHTDQILLCFVFSCVAYLLYINYCFFSAGLYTNFRPAEFNNLPFRDVLMSLKVGSGHPTFISMWFLFSTLFLIHYFLENKLTFSKKLGLFCIVAMMIFTSLLLSAKITVIAFFFSLLLLVILMVKRKRWIMLSFGLITFIFLVSVFNISFLRARFIDEFKYAELKPPIGLNTNSLNIRVGIFECSKIVFKNNWLIGTGVGDIQDELNKCYSTFDTDVYKGHRYNTHNYYFDIAISTGIIGFIAFMTMLGFHIKDSIRNRNTLSLVFFLFIIICMIPENILSRNHGVIFFSLFSSLFIKQNLDHSLCK